MMSIFSPPSSFTIACTRRPRCPMHAPRASRPGCRARTAIFVREPAERGGRLFQGHDLAQLDVRLDALRRVELDLDLGILDLLDDGLQQIDPERSGLHVDLDVDVLLIAVRALDRSGDDVADDLFW